MSRLKFLAAAAALSATTTTATAQSWVPIVENSEMQITLFRVDEGSTINVDNFTRDIYIERASHDRAVGVYCEWSSAASIGLIDNMIGNVTLFDHWCRASTPEDLAQYDWPNPNRSLVTDAESLFGDLRVERTPDFTRSVVTERSLTGPNAMDIVSEYRREWDFVNDTVCVSSQEGIDGEEPYIFRDNGCYDIPDNDYAEQIEQMLLQF